MCRCDGYLVFMHTHVHTSTDDIKEGIGRIYIPNWITACTRKVARPFNRSSLASWQARSRLFTINSTYETDNDHLTAYK